jgi:hypothetical protein
MQRIQADDNLDLGLENPGLKCASQLPLELNCYM